MRVFIGVFPPPEVQAAAASVIDSLRRPGDGISWIKRENLHYTLRFIGEVGEDGASRCEEAAREAATKSRRFDAVLGRPGAFPDARRARVLWLGLAEGDAALVALAHDFEAALVKRGFDRADKPFSPHLTLGRVRERNRDLSAALARVNPLANDSGSHFTVAGASVVESTLSPQGSIYRVLTEAPLRE